MEDQQTGTLAQADLERMTPVLLTERHVADWLRLLDHLQDTHAPNDELIYCRTQVTRLQLDLFRLRNS